MIESLTLDRSLGQVWTPEHIAQSMTADLRNYLPSDATVLDPACGPGTFADSAAKIGWTEARFTSIDIDAQWVSHVANLVSDGQINGDVINADFINFETDELFDGAILNPPYIRHENISRDRKEIIGEYVFRKTGHKLSGRSNLLVFFLIKSALMVKPGGYISAIVYDSLRASEYGAKALQILNTLVETKTETIIPAPFEGAMIDAHLMILRRRHRQVKLATNQSRVAPVHGHCPMSELFKIQRGAALSPRKELVSNNHSSTHPDATIVKALPPNTLVASANKWSDHSLVHNLESFRGPIIFNYYIRNHPRFLINPDNFVASDNYLILKPLSINFLYAKWFMLNSSFYLNPIMANSRSQGSGLKKLQVYQLKDSLVPDWRLLPDNWMHQLNDLASNVVQDMKSNVSRDLDYNIFNEILHSLGIKDHFGHFNTAPTDKC